MIEINLLPEELKKAKRVAKRLKPSQAAIILKSKLKVFAIGVFGFLIFIYVITTVAVVFQNYRIEKLSAKWEEIRPQSEKLNAVKTDLRIFNNKISSMNKMMSRRFSWSQKLNSLSDSVIPGIWLTKISIEENAKRSNRPREISLVSEKVLAIKGSAVSMTNEATAIIGKFMKSLQRNEKFSVDFEKIELGSISNKKAADIDVKDFELICTFKTKEFNERH